MISIEEAREIIGSHTAAPSPLRTPFEQALGHILAEEVLADSNYPSESRSMMDGYVVREDATPGQFKVVGEISAADVPGRAIAPGEAMRIFTGAMIPPLGGRVVMQEVAIRNGEQVTIAKFPDQPFIREAASEAESGLSILATGTLIGPAEIAILARVGHTTPLVIPKPSVIHIANGDELVPPDESPAPGRIRDTNSSLLRALSYGLVSDFQSSRIPDSPPAMRSACDNDSDLLLISGGASVGDHDHGAAVLRELGFTIHFNQVNLRPGKPLTFATNGKRPAFVIPGNPVSHFVCYHVAIKLALELLCARQPDWQFLNLEFQHRSLLEPNPRDTFRPASVTIHDGKLTATPLPWSSSGNTFSLSRTNALIRESTRQTLLLDLPHPARSPH